MPRRVTILGSTGSIGTSALDVLRAYPDDFELVGLTAGSNAALVAAQIREFHPAVVALNSVEAAAEIRRAFPRLEVLEGPAGVLEVAGRATDVVLAGIVGAAGLRPVLKAIAAGNTVALANKEPMVMAGELIMAEAERRGVRVLPVDSEHNAIFQCIEGHRREDIYRVYLTASGGPFYNQPRESLAGVTPEQAVNHPTWDMGAKISVDSATLMNKGLEVIEAKWLFGLELDQISVLIHPQSIIHSLVEFTDGNILAHLGVTDMRLPIQFALTWPNRVRSPMARLDLTRMPTITFAAPDFGEFPCLGLALDAAREGGTATTVLNAANEAAVEAFRAERISFLEIATVVEHALTACETGPATTLEKIEAADAAARAVAESAIKRAAANRAGAR